MPIPVNRPLNEAAMCEGTTSIATAPVVAVMCVPIAGFVERVMAAAGGTTTGTINVAVSINGGADITGGNLNVAAGGGARAGAVWELGVNGAGATDGVWVNEGDILTFTPSGGTGNSIPGAFTAVIRTI